MLAGSTQATSNKDTTNHVPAEIQDLGAKGRRLFDEGRYSEARQIYLRAAARSRAPALVAHEAMYWNNVGACDIAT
jgi:hypothetical protein